MPHPNWFQVAKALFLNGHWKTWTGNIQGVPAYSCDYCKINAKEFEPLQHMDNCPAGKMQKILYLNSDGTANLSYVPIEVVQYYSRSGMNIDKIVDMTEHRVTLTAQNITDEWEIVRGVWTMIRKDISNPKSDEESWKSIADEDFPVGDRCPNCNGQLVIAGDRSSASCYAQDCGWSSDNDKKE